MGYAIAQRSWVHLRAETLEQAHSQLPLNPDVIVIDVLLPDSTCIADTVAFLQGPAAGIPAIVHTSFWLKEVDRAAAAEGLTLIRKSDDYGPLLDLIQKACLTKER